MFRAKTYVNRKNEHKLQLSGDASDLQAFLKGDAQAKKAIEEAIQKALETPAWGDDES